MVYLEYINDKGELSKAEMLNRDAAEDFIRGLHEACVIKSIFIDGPSPMGQIGIDLAAAPSHKRQDINSVFNRLDTLYETAADVIGN